MPQELLARELPVTHGTWSTFSAARNTERFNSYQHLQHSIEDRITEFAARECSYCIEELNAINNC